MNTAKKTKGVACTAVMLARGHESRLAKIGVKEDSDYTVNEKQVDYFCSESVRELIKKKENMSSIEEMKAKILETVNKAFLLPCMQLYPAPMYLHLKCHFAKCPY